MSMIDGSMDDDRIAAETVSREARERLNAGSFEEAVVLYEKALASDPGRWVEIRRRWIVMIWRFRLILSMLWPG